MLINQCLYMCIKTVEKKWIDVYKTGQNGDEKNGRSIYSVKRSSEHNCVQKLWICGQVLWITFKPVN